MTDVTQRSRKGDLTEQRITIDSLPELGKDEKLRPRAWQLSRKYVFILVVCAVSLVGLLLTRGQLPRKSWSLRPAVRPRTQPRIIRGLFENITTPLLAAPAVKPPNANATTTTSPPIMQQPTQQPLQLAENYLNEDLYLDKCWNTVQGPVWITDNVGRICRRSQLNDAGCCTKRLNIAPCEGCRSDLQCCSTFEHCVACCLQTNRVEGAASLETFDECSHVCRVSSRSTTRGNRYTSPLKNCYSLSESDDLASGHGGNKGGVLHPTWDSLPEDGASLVAAEEVHMNCMEVCAAKGQQCHEAYLKHMANNCDTLKRFFPCKSCSGSKGADQPAMDASSNMCYINNEVLDCHGFHANTKRLCACLTLSGKYWQGSRATAETNIPLLGT